jgi:D-3-phosphoglycerate dehydrogenase
MPFSEASGLPMATLKAAGFEVVVNPLGRRLQDGEITQFISDVDAIIAGTERLSEDELKDAKQLKIISRVGIGLDGLDLNYCKENDIVVTYTPDAPAPAVAELAVANIINGLRNIPNKSLDLKGGVWSRTYGRRISEVKVGIVGCGRIGSRVIRRLTAFGAPRFLVNDLKVNPEIDRSHKISWVGLEQLFQESDVVTLHVPLTKATRNLIDRKKLQSMKPGSIFVNTSRGGIVDEQALLDELLAERISFAAIDVFSEEPYSGPLRSAKNALLTPHLGSMTVDCRSRMEQEACESVVEYFSSSSILRGVPHSEYLIQQ